LRDEYGGALLLDLDGHGCVLSWTEERSLLNNAHRWAKEAVSNIRSEIPFPMYGIDTDNGGEFINTQLLP
jgi:hypothetical protein